MKNNVTKYDYQNAILGTILPLSDARHKILFVLALHVNHSGVCFPAYEQIMHEAHVRSKSTVRSAIRYFCECRIMTYVKGSGNRCGGQGKANTYQLHLDELLKYARPKKRPQESTQTVLITKGSKESVPTSQKSTWKSQESNTAPKESTNECTLTTIQERPSKNNQSLQVGSELKEFLTLSLSSTPNYSQRFREMHLELNTLIADSSFNVKEIEDAWREVQEHPDYQEMMNEKKVAEMEDEMFLNEEEVSA